MADSQRPTPLAPPANPKDEITVLVFKENLAARTFKISLSWISKLGVLIGCLAFITLCAIIWGTKNYYTVRRTDPGRVQQLEQELRDLKVANESLEAKAKTTETAAAAKPVVPPPAAEPAAPPAADPAAPPATASGSGESAGGGHKLFSALPAGVHEAPEIASPSITLDAPRFNWSTRTRMLHVKFNLQYIHETGNQQGRIVLLARGPEAIHAHPAGVLNTSGKDNLISPERGEYFSVSRFREVKADFPSSSPEAVKEVEALLFNQYGQILIHHVFPVELSKAAPAPAKPAAVPAAAAGAPKQPSPAVPAKGTTE